MHKIVYIYLAASFFTLSLQAAEVPFNESRVESLSKGMCEEFGKLGSCDHEHPLHCISNASVVPRQGTRGLFTLKNHFPPVRKRI